MSEDEIRSFLEPHFTVLRALSSGAGDREIREAKSSIRVILSKFNYDAVHEHGRRAQGGLDRALKFVDLQKKNDMATEAAGYFLDRAFVTICECESEQKS